MTISRARIGGTLQTMARFLEITGVILKEGLLYLFRRESVEEHLYRGVIQLGPTFIKLGQMASTRPDFVPEHISARFRVLQEHVPPFPFEEAKALIEAELGRSLDSAFATFSPEPEAAASLSQVYFARLPDGLPVAVKVQRPGIDRLIHCDLAILRAFAWLAERVNRVARDLHVSSAVQEFGRWTLKELDFEIEAHNAEVFRRNFTGWDDVIFPRIHWSHTTARVLTMQRVSGLRVGEVAETVGPQFGRKLAKRLAEIEMKMFITDAFFHADLHPGNIFFQPDGRIAVLDLGMVGQMTTEQRDRFLAYWIAITRRARDRAFYHLIQMAVSTAGADLDGFRASYDVSFDRFYDKDLSECSLAQTYLDIVINGARFGVVFPSEMVLQAKAVVTAEALDLVLAPDFRFADEVRPIVAAELARRVTPRRLLDHLWDGLTEWVLLGETPPLEMPDTDEVPEEAEFRGEARASLVHVWLDAIDESLRNVQGDVSRYTSATYWIEHPERRALLETTFGFLRLAARELGRVRQESHFETVHQSGNGSDASPGGAQRRWQAFLRSSSEGSATDDLEQVFDYLGDLIECFEEADFWETRSADRAGLVSALTLLRFWLAQLGQAANEGL